MPQFLIEREIAGVGSQSPESLQAMACKAFEQLHDPARHIEWLYSYVTENKTYCVYLAPDEEVLRQRSQAAGFPVARVSEVTSMLEPPAAVNGG
jgi:hypothetical protein